jgi:hypothetical protein
MAQPERLDRLKGVTSYQASDRGTIHIPLRRQAPTEQPHSRRWIMGSSLKRLLVSVALGAALASTKTTATYAMPIPATTANAIAGPAPTEQVWWRGYGWRGGWGWGGGGALAAGLIVGGLIGAAAAAPYYAYPYPYHGYAYPSYPRLLRLPPLCRRALLRI